MRDKRQKANRAGARAEAYAALFLMMKGYRVLARRVKTPVGEIDLIVRRKNRLAFVEVKSRKTASQGLYAVTLKQQQRIKKAAQYWLARQKAPLEGEMGFDVVVVVPWHLPMHHKDAFSHTPY